MLNLQIPKIEEAKPRAIEVKVEELKLSAEETPAGSEPEHGW